MSSISYSLLFVCRSPVRCQLVFFLMFPNLNSFQIYTTKRHPRSLTLSLLGIFCWCQNRHYSKPHRFIRAEQCILPTSLDSCICTSCSNRVHVSPFCEGLFGIFSDLTICLNNSDSSDFCFSTRREDGWKMLHPPGLDAFTYVVGEN